MSVKKIYVSGENIRDPKLIEIEEDGPISEIIIVHQEITKGIETIEEIEIFIEDEDEPCNKEQHSGHAGIHHHKHIHCHRCKKIEVEMEYNNVTRKFHASPATTGEKLHTLIPKYFTNISEKDAANLNLELKPGEIIQANEHLGVFVAYPRCYIKIKLVSKTNVQG